MNGPANNSIQAISTYIQEYIDPQNNLSHDDDAEQVLAELDIVFADDGGTGLTVEQMREYLDTLPQ